MGATRDNKNTPPTPPKPDADDTAEVIAQKEALEVRGRACGVEVDRRHSLADITAQVEYAEAAAAAEQLKAKADAEAAAEQAEAEAAAAEKKPPFTVAPGVAISCLRGVIGEGQAITARDFNSDLKAGDEKLKEFVKKKKIVKN